jgi:phosphate uptake regulator
VRARFFYHPNERFADHAVAIAKRVVLVVTGEVEESA